jgi:hypothetical protein
MTKLTTASQMGRLMDDGEDQLLQMSENRPLARKMKSSTSARYVIAHIVGS